MHILLILLFLLSALQGDTLSVAFGEYNDEPLIFTDSSGAVTGGIFAEIMDSLSSRSNTDYRLRNIPRKRLEQYLISGKLDLYLKMNPKWVSDSTHFLWSVPLFQENDILVSRSSQPLQFNDSLQHKKIGTILGFYYPTLQQKFESGLLIRTDAHSFKANMGKLKLNRVDAVVDSDILILFKIKEELDAKSYFIAPQKVASHSVHAIVSKTAYRKKELLSVLKELRDDGTIDSILQKYR